MVFSYNWHAFSSKTGHYRRKTIWQDKKRNCTKTAQRKKTMLGNIIPNFQKPVKLIKCHSNLSIMLYLTISSTFWHDVSFFQTEDQNYFLCSSKKYGRSICTWKFKILPTMFQAVTDCNTPFHLFLQGILLRWQHYKTNSNTWPVAKS